MIMWTSTALASEHRHYAGEVWRVVEAQHRISTNRLSINRDEQSLLEELIEEIKPRLPASAHHLDYLLAAPFRYGHAGASRFRKSGELPGIFYSAETEETALAEAAYWRLRFLSRSPGFRPPTTTTEHSSFRVAIRSERALDLTLPPFDEHEKEWTDPVDYTVCQQLAAEARIAGTEILRTRSVRDAAGGCNVVILDPAAFVERTHRLGRTWHFRFQDGRLLALAAFPSPDQLEFTAAGFGLDEER
ncbi:RES family NAD+ phosphorylase [Novosphingobium flavum]